MNLLEPAPTRIDLNFHLYDTPVRVSGWFWVIPGLIAIPLVSVSSIGYFFIVAGCFFGSILLHEFGHVVAGRRFGAESYVVLNGIGGIAVGCAEVAERWQRVVVYAAGPLAQLLLGGFLWLTSDRILHLVEPSTYRLGPFHLTLMMLQGINVVWPLLNLVPVWPLDGYHIGRELLDMVRGHNRPAWEQDADWWKRDAVRAGYRSSRSEEDSRRSRRNTLLIFVSAIVLLVGWFAWSAHRNRVRRQALLELRQLGVEVGWDYEDTFYGFNFQGTNVGDEKLALIEQFPEVIDIDLAGTRVTDAGLIHLRGLSRLEMVNLQNTAVTDGGLTHLRRLTGLRLLDLSGTRVMDTGLEDLLPLQKLEWLSLSRTGVTDAGLARLKELTNLRMLHVFDGRVSEEGIADLRKARPALVVNPSGETDE